MGNNKNIIFFDFTNTKYNHNTMKAIFAVALIAMISFGSATSLAELDRTPYGKSLIDSAFLSMQLGDPASKIVEMLQNEEVKINEKQDQMDSDHAAFQESCDADIAQYEQNIAKAEEDLRVNKAALAKAEAEEKVLVANLEEATTNLAATQQTLAEETAAYNEFKATSQARRSELRQALSLFEQAKQVLKNYDASTGFLQTNSGASLANKLKESNVPDMYKPIVKILIQAAQSSKLSGSAIDTINALLDQLLDNAQSTLDQLIEEFNQRTDAWNARKADLEGKIARLQARIADLNSQLQAVRTSIQTYKANIADAQERFENNTTKLQQRPAECEAEQAKYERDTEENNRFLEAIAQVIEIFNNRVVEFTKYINESRENVNIE